MKKTWIILIFALLLLPFLSGCGAEIFAADRLPWISDEPVLFRDDFSTRGAGWSTHEDSISFSGYSQGGFRLWTTVPDYQFWSVPGLNFKDVHIFTKAMVMSPSQDNIYGVLCRYQDASNYYALMISSDGYYGIFKVLAGEKTLIDQRHMDFSDVIHRGAAINKIQAVCQADQLTLLVNDSYLLQVQDDSLTHGDVGLIIGNFSQAGTDILFDNFIVLNPSS